MNVLCIHYSVKTPQFQEHIEHKRKKKKNYISDTYTCTLHAHILQLKKEVHSETNRIALRFNSQGGRGYSKPKKNIYLHYSMFTYTHGKIVRKRERERETHTPNEII